MSSTSKLRLLIDIQSKLKGGLDKAKKRVNKATGDMQKRLDQFKVKNVEAFNTIKSEIPGVERALSMLKNPYILATAAAVAFTVAIGKASTEAMSFEHSFMNIRQLNLDKTRQELNTYRAEIKNTALDTGINLKKMTEGYYDLQSGLGVYGKDASAISKQIGMYAVSTQADYNDSINQTVKAMKAFKIGVGGVKSLLESNAKTVQVGIVTYAELAKVQTEYAGTASAAGQSIDTANKLFASFTSIAKNADIAATMTKTAFEGFADPKVLGAIEGYGVKVYDASGNMRSLDKVIKDTSVRIDKMNDQEFNEFMGSVGGPEGLRKLFGKLRTGADDFFKTIDAYDNSAVDLSKMYKNAMQDPITVWNMVKENFNAMFASIGLKFLGVINTIGIGILQVIDWVRENKAWFEILGGAIIGIGVAWSILNAQIIAGKIAVLGMAVATKIATAAQWLFNIAANANPIGIIVIAIAALIGGLVVAYNKFDKFRAIIQGSWAVIKGFGNILKEYVINRVQDVLSGLGKLANAIGLLLKGNFSEAWDVAKSAGKDLVGSDTKKKAFQQTVDLKDNFSSKYNEVMEKAAEKKAGEESANNPNLLPPDGTTPDFNPISTTPNSANATNNADRIATAASGSSKTTNINIDSFIKNFSPTHQSINSMNEQELEKWLTQMFMRVINSAEMA